MHTIDTILIEKEYYNIDEAWEKALDYIDQFQEEGWPLDLNILDRKGMEETDRFYRFKLNEYKLFPDYFVKTVPQKRQGVKFIMIYYK